MRIFFKLFWRLLPIFILVWVVRGSAVEYNKYFVMAKNASRYAMTYINLSQYVSSLEQHYAENGNLPSDISAFLRTSYVTKGRDPSLDYWDTPYQLTAGEYQFILTSCGPDRACPNEDDLSSSGKKIHTPVFGSD